MANIRRLHKKITATLPQIEYVSKFVNPGQKVGVATPFSPKKSVATPR